MAKVTVKTGAVTGKTFYNISVGPKEAQALRDVLGNVAGDETSAAYWAHNVRDALTAAGVDLLPTRAHRRARYDNKAITFVSGSK